MNVANVIAALRKANSLCHCEKLECEQIHSLKDLREEMGEKEAEEFMSNLKEKITCPNCRSDKATSTYVTKECLAAYCRTCQIDMDIDNYGNITVVVEPSVTEEEGPEATCPTCQRKINDICVWLEDKEWLAYCEICSITFNVQTGKVDMEETTKTDAKPHHKMVLKDQTYSCDTCKFETKRIEECALHETVLVGEDPHWTKHAGEKRWVCMYCGAEFTDVFANAMAHENELGKKLYNASFKGGGSGYGGQSYVHCTHKPQGVLKAIDEEGWVVYAGRKVDCEPYLNNYDIILNLSGMSVSKRHIIPFQELKSWEFGGKKKFQEIALNWPDMGVVDLPLEFWKDFYKFLKKKGNDRLKQSEKNKEKIQPIKVLVFCIGGHGRTGTAVACMLVACFGWTANQAITWVRTNMCSKCIETKSQESYIYEMAGEEPPKSVETKITQMTLSAWEGD